MPIWNLLFSRRFTDSAQVINVPPPTMLYDYNRPTTATSHGQLRHGQTRCSATDSKAVAEWRSDHRHYCHEFMSMVATEVRRDVDPTRRQGLRSSAFRFAKNNFDSIRFDSRQEIDSNRFVRFDSTVKPTFSYTDSCAISKGPTVE